MSARLGALLLILGLAPANPAAHAQELLPELAEPAAKHKAADEALDKQKQNAIALAAKSYVSALDSIEKSATTAGQLDLVAAVVKEREAVASGSLEPDIPAALPKAKLQTSRKTLLASLERIKADFAKRRKQADADYLRFLATLQTKAASNPELAKQLASEKAALLAGAGNGSQAKQKAHGKNVVMNGDFEIIVDGKPDGWKIEGSPSERKNVEALNIATEGNNTFVRFDEKAVTNDGQAKQYWVKRAIEFPKDAKTVTVSARIRTKARIDIDSEKPNANVRFDDQDGKQICLIGTTYSYKNASWNTFQNTGGSVPKAAVRAFVQIMNGTCPTQIDFDDIEVTFK